MGACATKPAVLENNDAPLPVERPTEAEGVTKEITEEKSLVNETNKTEAGAEEGNDAEVKESSEELNKVASTKEEAKAETTEEKKDEKKFFFF